MTDAIAIVGGTGALGHGMAARMAAAGLKVTIGSRDAGRAEAAADELRALVAHGHVEGAPNRAAAQAAELVLLTVPFAAQARTLLEVAEALQPGQIVIDATVPLAVATGGKATRMLGVWQGSAAEQAQELVPRGVAVVSALHTVSASALAELDAPLDEDVLVCGRRRQDKRRVAWIIDLVPGLRCVDAGPLENARIVESTTALLIGVNGRYRTHAGIRLTGLPGGDLFPPLTPRSDQPLPPVNGS